MDTSASNSPGTVTCITGAVHALCANPLRGSVAPTPCGVTGARFRMGGVAALVLWHTQRSSGFERPLGPLPLLILSPLGF